VHFARLDKMGTGTSNVPAVPPSLRVDRLRRHKRYLEDRDLENTLSGEPSWFVGAMFADGWRVGEGAGVRSILWNML